MIKPEELRIGNYVQETDDYYNSLSDEDKYYNDHKIKSVLSLWEIGMYYNNPFSNEHQCSLSELSDAGYIDYDILEPIPLTEEWLVKFGIKGMHSKKLTKGIKLASYGNGEYQIYVATEMHAITTEDLGAIRIKHVHQLQNLYFALTGKELTIKELTE